MKVRKEKEKERQRETTDLTAKRQFLADDKRQAVGLKSQAESSFYEGPAPLLTGFYKDSMFLSLVIRGSNGARFRVFLST